MQSKTVLLPVPASMLQDSWTGLLSGGSGKLHYLPTTDQSIYFNMTPFARLLTVLLLFLIGTSARAQDADKSFHDLRSLTGKWSLETSKGTVYESWLKLNDSTFKGLSFRVSGKDTAVLEQMELVLRKGRIMFIPTVPGQNKEKPVVFTLAKLENNEYRFENKEHDFPKRVVYLLPKDNILQAWIEGDINGQIKRIDFKFKKVE